MWTWYFASFFGRVEENKGSMRMNIPIFGNKSNGNENGLAPVQEVVGRTVFAQTIEHELYQSMVRGNVDATRTNYKFWDEFRRGLKEEYSLASLFAIPTTEILASRVLGEGATVTLAKASVEDQSSEKIEYTNNKLTEWFQGIHSQLMRVLIDLYGLGDQYVVVNPNGTISVPSPEMVVPTYHPLDYRRLMQVEVITRTEKVEIRDIYTDRLRTWKVKNRTAEQVEFDGLRLPPNTTVQREFVNLIGRVPIIHLANDRSANEIFGRPVYEQHLGLFGEYNDLLKKGLRGAQLMGNPIPTLEGMKDVDVTVTANSRDTGEQYTDEDGSIQNRPQLVLDEETVMVLGEGGHFRMVAPAVGFTEDVRSMLKLLFLLFLETMGIPEAAWGGEMGQARSTSVEQAKTFHKSIGRMRVALETMIADATSPVNNRVATKGGLLGLVDLWLRMRALTDKEILVAPAEIEWPALALPDEQMRFNKTRYGHERGLIQNTTALRQLELPGIHDPDKEVAAAQVEMVARGDLFDQALDSDFEDEDRTARGEKSLPKNDMERMGAA